MKGPVRPVGRPANTGNRFNKVSRAHASVYIAGLSDGMVKVGFTDNPRTRLESVDGTSFKRFGCRIVEFHVYESVGALPGITPSYRNPRARQRALKIEAMCISSLCAVGTRRAPMLEYFDGISYEAAKAVVDSVIASVTKESDMPTTTPPPITFAEQYAFAKSVMASASKPAGKMMLSRMLRGNPYIKESSGVQSA